MNLEEYVQHWDNKINKWFLSPNEVVTDKDDFQYEYMPEPYIGNPYNPSSVILNFNPGIGVCHSWMALKDVQGSLIHKVANSTYSKVFMDFPYLRNGKSIELLHWDNSPGRKWWKERYKWIDHIVNKTCGNNCGLMPFALELCPWHSAKWNSNKFIIKLENDDEFKQSVETNVISVFEEAIRKSHCPFGICIGKKFDDVLSIYGYDDVTKEYYQGTDKDGYKLIPNINRYYRIFRKDDIIVLNTWHQGGNRTPSMAFGENEIELIKKIVNIVHLKQILL